jgi:hypothetical protein
MPASTSSSEILLPANFPENLPVPKFQIGDRVRWLPMPSQDYGTVIGFAYSLATHLQAWHWQYVVWLDADSPSHRWITTETAWETDLEPLAEIQAPSVEPIEIEEQ